VGGALVEDDMAVGDGVTDGDDVTAGGGCPALHWASTTHATSATKTAEIVLRSANKGVRSMSAAVNRITRIFSAGIVAVGAAVAGSAPRAAALPPGFPNLDSFTAVPVDPYIGTGPKGPKRFVSFSTPYNIECNMIATIEPVPAGSSQGINCEGDIPGEASGGTPTESCAVGSVGEWATAGFRLDRELTTCPIGTFSKGALLNIGQKVSYQNVTCAVGGDGLVACLDSSLGQHGFVLNPPRSFAF
jgi:hypothetical protein